MNRSYVENLEGIKLLENMPNWDGKSEFGLDNIKKVLESLNNPQDKPFSIHVAGTNGKGSVATAVEQILRYSGFMVGLITSPHLIKLNERIKINGRDIGDIYLSESIIKVEETAEKLKIKLSKHEIITAASFVACQDMDWIVVEVGLGGRLDASNVLKKPKAATIVTIDYDHQNILGNSLIEIAEEKAGIIKTGENVIIGQVSEEVKNTIKVIAKEKNAHILCLGEDFNYEINEFGEVIYTDNNNREMKYNPNLLGQHQAHNMTIAAAIGTTLGANIEECCMAIESCNLKCRLEKIELKNKFLLFDSAHNPAGIKSLISFLESQKLNNLEILFGVFQDKAWHEMVDLLIPHIVKWNIVQPNSERGLDVEALKSYLESKGINDYQIFESVENSASYIITSCYNSVIVGSMNLVGEARGIVEKEIKDLN